MEDPEIISLDESFEESPQHAKHLLVGKILAPKALNRTGVQNIIEKVWRTEEEYTVSPWRDNIYAFGFKNEDDLCRILSNGPWSVMGYLLILRKWDTKKAFNEMDFNFCPFWIQIHGLPIGFLNSKSGTEIAKTLGKIIEVEEPGDGGKMTNYLRIRVWLEVTKPLKKGFVLRRTNEEDLWVTFKYERLSEFCYGCGRIGHGAKDCKEKCSFDPKEWKFGSSLRAANGANGIHKSGDKLAHKLVYPDNTVGDIGSLRKDNGGACRTTTALRVNSENQNILCSDLVVNQGSNVVDGEAEAERAPRLGKDTSQEKTRKIIEGSADIYDKDNSDSSGPSEPQRDGPFLFRRSGLEVGKPNEDRPVYIVEEPDSPRQARPVGKNYYEVSLKPIELEDVGPLSIVGRPGLGRKVGEEGLASVFNAVLNLKRKNPEESREEEGGKKLKLITLGENDALDCYMEEGDTYEAHNFQKSSATGRGRHNRGRGRRGGRGNGRPGNRSE